MGGAPDLVLTEATGLPVASLLLERWLHSTRALRPAEALRTAESTP